MTESGDLMTRREALARVGYLLGGALSASTVAGVLAGCSARSVADAAGWMPRTLSREQGEMVAVMGELIIPETDTPGAKAARVNEFIDVMMTEYYPRDERDRFLAGLRRVDERARRAFGKPFTELAPEQQTALVKAINRASFPDPQTKREAGGPPREPVLQQGDVETGRSLGSEAVVASGGVTLDSDWDPEDVGRNSFFRTMKELVLVGYYTSEAGGTQELRQNPMGTWKADIPLADVGRAWA